MSNFFCHDTNIVYWTIFTIHLHNYASTNMGKYCLLLVLTLFPHFSPYARQFSKQTDKKNPCWAVFSIIYSRWWTQQTCVLPIVGLSTVQTSESTSETWGNTPLVLLLCNDYGIVYGIVATVSGYVSYHGKLYCCRPTYKPTCLFSSKSPVLETWLPVIKLH